MELPGGQALSEHDEMSDALRRLVRYAGQCGVQVTFLDFDVEPSPSCSKDYLSLGVGVSTRYCGSTLASTMGK